MPNTARLRVEPLEDRVTPVAAGALDPTFSGDGTLTTSSPVLQLALIPDGRILALSADSVARFEADGDPDPTFAGGVAVLPADDQTGVIAAAADGGFYYGTLTSISQVSRAFSIVHYSSAGVYDTAFGTGGTATIVIPGQSVETSLHAILVQPDGGVVVVGDRTADILALNVPRYYDVVVGRLTPTGQPDPTFGTNGTAVLDNASGGVTSLMARGATLAPDGRIVFATAASDTPRFTQQPAYTPAAVRLTTTGQLDSTFGTGGVAKVATGGFVGTVRVLDDGRVMLAGEVSGRDPQDPAQRYVLHKGLVVRLTADGRLDPTYDGDGIVVTGTLSTDRPEVLIFGPTIKPAIDPAGRVVFGLSGQGMAPAYRLNPAGAPDTTFGTNGTASVPTLGSGSASVLVQPNGDILFGGGVFGDSTSGSLTRLVGVATPAGFTAATAGTFVAGGPTDGTVQVFSYSGPGYSGITVASPSAYVAGLGQNVRPALADVTGDGTPDYVLAAGPGGPPRVVVLDGATGRVAADFAPFEQSFTGGAFAAAADLDLDGRAELIVTPDQGGGGRVVVFSVAAGGAVTARASFFGIDDPNFRGGARVAAGDVDRDGTPDVIVAAGFGGGPRVAIFRGAGIVTGSSARLTNDFFAFPGADAERLRNGAYVAAGDCDGDGFADLIFGGGPGGAPRVFILSGALVSTGNVAGRRRRRCRTTSSSSPGTSDRGGVRVAARDVDGDGRADLATGTGAGVSGIVRIITTAAPKTSEQFPIMNGVFGATAVPDGILVG